MVSALAKVSHARLCLEVSTRWPQGVCMHIFNIPAIKRALPMDCSDQPTLSNHGATKIPGRPPCKLRKERSPSGKIRSFMVMGFMDKGRFHEYVERIGQLRDCWRGNSINVGRYQKYRDDTTCKLIRANIAMRSVTQAFFYNINTHTQKILPIANPRALLVALTGRCTTCQCTLRRSWRK